MKYKVGDKVRIKSLDWYNENKDKYGYVWCTDFLFTPEHSKYCGCEFTISHITEFEIPSYVMESNGHEWTDEMIECKVEEETKPEPKFKVGDKVILDLYPCIVTDVHWRDSLHGFVYTVRGTDFGKIVKEDELVFDERPTPTTDEIVKNIKADWNNFKNRYNLPKDYHFVDKNGNEINISEIVLEKKKKEYPKTYDECCKVLDFCGEYFFTTYEEGIHLPENDNIVKIHQILKSTSILTKLIICRDAYWMIAGEEMGLGKPWEPDWKNEDDKFIIQTYDNEVGCWSVIATHRILAFPTAEMRDVFYENFKKEIEICKELL